MNYIIEDNFNFFNELNKEEDTYESSENKNEQLCLISHMPLTFNSVKLPCNHVFNYLPLYDELVLVHAYNKNINIKCPYCRTISTRLLPYIPLPGVEKRYGINSPKSLCMNSPKCLYKMKNGKYKGLECGKDGMEGSDGTFCKKHFNLIHLSIEENDKIKNNTTPTIIWTPEKEDLFKRKSIAELKQMLKEKGMKTSGLKKELVNRIFIYNGANTTNNANDIISLL